MLRIETICYRIIQIYLIFYRKRKDFEIILQLLVAFITL